MKAILDRFMYSRTGTYGIWHLPERDVFTVERPWLDNAPNVSCIPEGEYELVVGRFNRGGYAALEFRNVPDRTLIKVHKANYPTDVEGCIAPGMAMGWLAGRSDVLAVTSSAAAFRLVMDAYPDGLTLTIRAQPGLAAG